MKRILTELQITAPPVSPKYFDVLCVTDLEDINEMPEVGFEGLFFVDDEVMAIIVNKDIPSYQRKRFTFAHELGHYELHRGKAKTYECNPSASLAKDAKSLHPDEIEANTFAAEFLMPEEWFRPDVAKMPFGLKTIFSLADKDRYDVSRLAAAYRYMDFCGYVAALITSSDGVVTSFRGTDEFLKDLNCFVSPGTRVSPTPDEKIHQHEYHEWLNANDILAKHDNPPVFEQSFEIPVMNRVVSLIYFEHEFEEEDDDF